MALSIGNPAAPPAWLDLDNDREFGPWRDWKHALYPATLEQLTVELEDASRPGAAELERMRALLLRYNMVIYRTPDTTENKALPLALGKQLGLRTLDSNLGAGPDAVTEIRIKHSGVHGRYIPYTDRPLSWHTDGYYNRLDRQIRAMALHCVRPAKSGGENELLDHEMAYLYLRELNPDYIAVLSAPGVMTIPANEVDGRVERPAQAGPVFSIDPNGHLHMRYTARKRNIEWQDTPLVREAVAALESLFASDCPWILRGALAAGEGLICNNILHNRRSFEDDPESPRLLYRLRYYEHS